MKTRVGILFGGKSAEHEISIKSAINVHHALDLERFEPVLIYIDKQGKWKYLKAIEDLSSEALGESGDNRVILSMGETESPSDETADLRHRVDVIFPVLHGPLGEDGSVQGLLELLGVPYVGSGILGSAVGMDKEVMKRLLRDAGIAIARFEVVTSADLSQFNEQLTVKNLGMPLFVKPANMGSSVGVSKVTDAAELKDAIVQALKFDTKVLIEEAIQGTEIECAVLGNEHPEASTIGRIAPVSDDFYSYDAKYVNDHGADYEVPAAIPETALEAARATALASYKVLCCEGMTRVDMFMQPDCSIVLNEVNTIPGFTKISMYPKLWQASGIGYTELVSRLIELAQERFTARQNLQTTYDGDEKA